MAIRVFGPYEVVARLATGGSGSVFLARQRGLERFAKLVCLKTMLHRINTTSEFLNEARLLARMNHKNCIRTYDVGCEQSKYYIAMEHIFGETLETLMTHARTRSAPIPRSVVAAAISSVADGLHYAHELKDSEGAFYDLVHRDVSPNNIMISYDGQPKILDFGVAKIAMAQVTQTGVIKGKAPYMSPEQITGGMLDRRTDLYSLGLVFYECLTTTRIFAGLSLEQITWKLFKEPPPPPSSLVQGLEPELDTICMRALAPDPADRFQTAQELSQALQDYLTKYDAVCGTHELAEFLQKTFPDRYEHRAQVLEQVRAGEYDEQQLLEVLDARAVLKLDFPDSAPPTVIGTAPTAAQPIRRLPSVGDEQAEATDRSFAPVNEPEDDTDSNPLLNKKDDTAETVMPGADLARWVESDDAQVTMRSTVVLGRDPALKKEPRPREESGTQEMEHTKAASSPAPVGFGEEPPTELSYGEVPIPSNKPVVTPVRRAPPKKKVELRAPTIKPLLDESGSFVPRPSIQPRDPLSQSMSVSDDTSQDLDDTSQDSDDTSPDPDDTSEDEEFKRSQTFEKGETRPPPSHYKSPSVSDVKVDTRPPTGETSFRAWPLMTIGVVGVGLLVFVLLKLLLD